MFEEKGSNRFLNEIVQLYLPSTNIGRSVDWYVKHFGFKLIWQEEYAANLKLSHGPLLFLKRTSIKQPIKFNVDNEVSPVISLKTTYLDEFHEYLKRFCLDISEINEYGMGINGPYKDFYVHDPDGNVIEVNSYPDLGSAFEKMKGN